MNVRELRSLAKEAGIKGFYNLRKAELEAALGLNEEKEKEVNKMENSIINEAAVNLEVSLNNEIKKEEVNKMERLSMTQLIAENNVEGIVSELNRSQKLDKAAFKMIKQESKNMKVVGSRQIIISAPLSEEGKPYLHFEVATNVSLESSLTRAASSKTMKFADKSMVIELEGTEELTSVNLDDSLFKEGKEYAAIQARVFKLLRGGRRNKVIRETLNLVISPSGLARVELNKDAELEDGEVMTMIRFLGVSPSGLRSKSIMGASVRRRTNETDIACDRRTQLLNKSIDGCVNEFLNEDNSFSSLKSKVEQFKNSTRLTMGAPGSKELDEISNYIVFNNIAAGAEFMNLLGSIVSACDTRDGNVLVSAQWMLNVLTEAGIPVNLFNVVGITDQLRGAGLKCSATYETRQDIVTLARHLISSESKAKVLYAVVNGVRYNSWDAVVKAGVAGELFNNLDAVADKNAMKLLGHNDVFRPVRLKMAYQSDMNLNLVTAVAMLNYKMEEAKEVLMNLGIKSIIKKFAQLGVKFEYSNGCVNGVELDLEGMKSLNNEEQFMSYLLKCDPEMTMKMFPGVIRSEFTNMIKGIAKTISKSEFELEESKYTVVQADLAVLFGKQILAENEMFCYGYKDGQLVSITRHPISALEAVTTLKIVGIEEVVRRILAMDLSTDKKLVLINYYGRAKQWCIIPASHRLMEKHDGMDFDIDAVQIIGDESVVNILKDITDRGSVIRSNDAANAARMTETPEEAAILAVQKNSELGFTRPGKVVSESTKATKSVISSRIQLGKVVQANETIDLSFDQVCAMTEDYFGTTIASVGVIANAFYVNGLTLATLKSVTVDIEIKNRIVKAFKKYYGCTGTKQYASIIDRTEAIYEVDKFNATESVFRFAECDGSLHSLIAFLEDCADYNRYLAETSIDSAKNNFYIINMFNHAKIVTPKGARQNCKVELNRADETFGDIAEALGYTQSNFFGLDLLEFNCKGLTTEQWDDCEGVQVNEFTGKLEQVPVQVEDPLYDIKEERRVIANSLIVAASKLFEEVVTSNDAKELRKDVSAYADSIINGAKVGPAIDAIKKSYSTLTLGLKSDELSSEEIEGISTVEYLKTVATNGIKNFKHHTFSDFNSLEIGAIACNSLIAEVNDDKCGTINAALYKVCEAEMIEFLADFGVDNVGFIGEAISYAELNGRKTKLDVLVGMNIVAIEGEAILEDGTVVVMKDRRADIAGTVVDINGKYFIKAVKEFDQVNAEDGMYINVNKSFDKYCVDADKFQAVSYRFESIYQLNKTTKVFYAVVGTNAEGQDALIVCLNGRANIAKVLKAAKLDNMSIFSHTNNKNNTTRVLHLPGADLVSAVDAVNNVVVSNDFSFDFVAPTGLDTTADQEAAVSQEENTDALFSGFDFGMPV